MKTVYKQINFKWQNLSKYYLNCTEKISNTWISMICLYRIQEESNECKEALLKTEKWLHLFRVSKFIH